MDLYQNDQFERGSMLVTSVVRFFFFFTSPCVRVCMCVEYRLRSIKNHTFQQLFREKRDQNM